MKEAKETSAEAPSAAPAGEEITATDLVEMILSTQPEAASSAPERIDGVVIGTLVGFDAAGEPRVAFPGAPSGGGVAARSTVELGEADLECEVALLFERGDPRRPMVMGRLHQPARPPAAAIEVPRAGAEVCADGRRVVFSAEEEIVLQCGQASITLTRAGKILIRGAYLLARASGVNRIQGGSVQIN
jgi:hypothetical protein